MKQINFYRVLQHDKQDQIKIGAAFPSNNLEKTVEATIESYNKDLEWCGGFEPGCNKYYKRIAIVDAETLSIIRLIFSNNDI